MWPEVNILFSKQLAFEGGELLIVKIFGFLKSEVDFYLSSWF